jgi:leader peptidase (prepilin peptidase)/N-methyltransferase
MVASLLHRLFESASVSAAQCAGGFLPRDVWALCGVFAAVFGACIGSFLNVCIYRIPLDQSVVAPRSHCMTCGKLIPWYHNLPVVSYFALRGRCASCGARFSFRYAAVELLVAFLFLFAFCLWTPDGGRPPFGARPLLVPGTPGDGTLAPLALVPVYWLFLSGLVVGTFIDFDHFILPDSVTIGGMVAGPVLSALVPAMQMRIGIGPEWGPDGCFIAPRLLFPTWWGSGLAWSLVGLAAGFVPLQLLRACATWYFRRRGRIGPEDEAMGFGDVKLMGAVGAFLGWEAAAFTVAVAALYGTLVAVPLLLARRRSMLSRLPFGPYLSLGAATWLFWGHRLVAAYLTLLPPWRVDPFHAAETVAEMSVPLPL